ncbi:MAG: hypothetical protein KBI01_06895 [Oscillospiraceae bacterium]|nr:hypothetical protein [Oscillospiraceae bacterium]
MNNIDIRFKAQEADVKLWRIAGRLNMNDGNFSRMLRKELPDAEKENIIQIINELSKESN